MRFYFDESGDFRLDGDPDQQVGIVVGITIPESAEPEVITRFDDFVATLPASAFKNGEPKGNLLTLEYRTRFSAIIAADDRIVVTPAILDISSINKANLDVRGGMVRRMRDIAEQCIHESMREQVDLLAKQFQNLSDNQSLRLCSVAYCIKRAFEQTIIVLSGREYFECWNEMRFEIDPAHVRPTNREQLVFKWTLLGWLQGWSQESPTTIIEEIHTADHPIVKHYSTADGKFDLKKLHLDNLHYPRSSESKGIQIADMAASIIRHAVHGIVTFDNLMNYGLLLKNNLWAPKYAHGLFCLSGPNDVDYSRYEGLTEAVAKVRGGEEWRDTVRSRAKRGRS